MAFKTVLQYDRSEYSSALTGWRCEAHGPDTLPTPWVTPRGRRPAHTRNLTKCHTHCTSGRSWNLFCATAGLRSSAMQVWQLPHGVQLHSRSKGRCCIAVGAGEEFQIWPGVCVLFSGHWVVQGERFHVGRSQPVAGQRRQACVRRTMLSGGAACRQPELTQALRCGLAYKATVAARCTLCSRRHGSLARA